MAMIGIVQTKNVMALRERPSQAQGKVVGFASGVDQETNAQSLRQCGAESSRVINQILVQVTGVGIE